MKWARWSGILAVAGALGVGAGEASAQSDSSFEAARQAYEQGVAALEANQFATAITDLEDSYRIRASPVVLRNLALAYRGAGRNADALEAFERYLAAPEPDTDPAALAAIRDVVSHLRFTVAVLALDVAPATARVEVDGREREPVDGAIALDPGRHTLRATAAGYLPLEQDAAVQAGEQRSLALHLVAQGAVGGAQPGGGGTRLLVYVGAGVAVLAAGAAVYLGVDGDAQAADYRQRCVDAMPTAGDCGTMHDQLTNSLGTRAAVIDVLWGAAGLGAVLAVVGLVTGHHAAPKQEHASLRPLVGPRGLGAEVVW